MVPVTKQLQMSIGVFRVVASFAWRFGGTYCLHVQPWRWS
jgi:hypothetical protein